MERSLKKFLSFVFVIFSAAAYADVSPSGVRNENIDAETNISIVENSIKINEDEFERVVEHVKKRYTDFDWDNFNALDLDARRIVLKNYLARLAFDEVKENYIKDIHARAKDGVSTENYGAETYYFNKSDAKYRHAGSIMQDLLKKAKKHHIIHPLCDDCSAGYVKQQDVNILDELIKQETAKAAIDIYCEKYCVVFDQEQEDRYQQFLSEFKNYLKEYKKIQKQYLSEIRKLGAPRKEIKEERRKIADEIRNQEERYAYWQMITKGERRWRHMPYTNTCEKVSITCWNVEKIPESYERFELKIEDYSDDGIININYDYDDLASNTHTQADAWRDCTCEQDVNDVNTYVYCNCDISFFDEIQDFTAVRNWENQSRIDIKNGINQDKTESGSWNHDWASNTIPGGKVFGRSLDIIGSDEKSVTK